ncbi:MAG: hypothetical protein AAGA83_00790, partial [Cyanobacteria bacterium P01_F01_bin.116]
SILRAHDLVVIEKEENSFILSIHRAKTFSTPVIKNINTDIDDSSFVTFSMNVEHQRATQLVSVLRTLIPQHGHFAVYRPNNKLIIVDFWDNIKRIHQVIKLIDVPLTPEQIKTNKEIKEENLKSQIKRELMKEQMKKSNTQ